MDLLKKYESTTEETRLVTDEIPSFKEVRHQNTLYFVNKRKQAKRRRSIGHF